jgi:hypothetical protein
MRDGAVHVAFHPKLMAEQYADLLHRVARSTTKDELRREMLEAAKVWAAGSTSTLSLNRNAVLP